MHRNPPGGILTVGLNPAWQKTLLFRELRVGDVNRAESVLLRASGKGINCTWSIHQTGEPSTVFQFCGGQTGQAVLADLDARGLRHVTVATAGATRTCTTVVSAADGRSTELIEPSAPVSPAEFAELRKQLLTRLPDCAGVALCGTVPPGVPPAFYADVIVGKPPQAVVLLDGHRDVLPALAAGPDIVKVNAAELTGLTGIPDPQEAAAACLARFPLRWLAVTAGVGNAYLFGSGRQFVYRLPPLPGVINTIGAGDCSDGTLLAAIIAGRSPAAPLPDLAGSARDRLAVPDFMAQAFRASLACASASCLTATPSTFSTSAAAALFPRITVEEHRLP